MRIAVNTRFLLKDYLEGVGYFVFENFRRIVKAHPEHEFIFIFDRPYDKRFVFAGNVIPVVAGPAARHPLLFKYWFDVNVPAVLRKYKADVFVSCDGFCSLTAKVPQCLVVHDLSFLHHPDFIKRSHYLFYRHYTPRFLRKAAGIATVSAFSRQDIASRYKIDPSRITIVHNAARESFHPATADEKERVKEQYTGGCEYFIYAGAVHPRKNLMNLLKAFSIFKKRQKSSMKLVIAGRLAWKYKHFVESLKSYKYRDDVILTGYLDEAKLAGLVASAYAMVYPSLWEGFGVPVLEAIRCRVPVITSAGSAMQEIAKDAALYADPSDHTDIAEKMMILYKDEQLKSRLIGQGEQIDRQYSWDRSAEMLWQAILGSVQSK